MISASNVSRLQPLHAMLRAAIADPVRNARRAAALGLSEDALRALRWAHWLPGRREWRLGFADGCAGRHLPSALALGRHGVVAASSVRSAAGRLQAASVDIHNRSLGSGKGTLTALLRTRGSGAPWYALTAGHVLASDPGCSTQDRVQLACPGRDVPLNARLAAWAPRVFDVAVDSDIDAAIALIGGEQVRELLDAGISLPSDTASLGPAGQALTLHTRHRSIGARSEGFGPCWMDIARTPGTRDYRLLDCLIYRPDETTVGGDSGAPIWDAHQRLVAMHVGAGPEGLPGTAVAVPYGRIQSVLDAWGCEALTRGMAVGTMSAPVAPVVPAAPAVQPVPPPAVTDGAIDTLARTIWGEARGEGEVGMGAVACVVLNRVRHQTYWGRSVDEVCRKPFQFSCWNERDPNRRQLLDARATDPSFAQALRVAADVIASRLPDPTQGATHYHARSLTRSPKWAAGHQPCAVIGRHLFFNDVR